MKKYLLILVSVLLTVISFGQGQPHGTPNYVVSGNVNTTNVNQGAQQTYIGFIYGRYTDTTTANNAPQRIKGIPFINIATTSDGKEWFRSVDTSHWIQSNGSTPNLQQVTDIGNITTDSIKTPSVNLYSIPSPSSTKWNVSDYFGIFKVQGSDGEYISAGAGQGLFYSNQNNITATLYPDISSFSITSMKYGGTSYYVGNNIHSGTTPNPYIPISVNGNYADTTGNITISTGGGGLTNALDTAYRTLGKDSVYFTNSYGQTYAVLDSANTLASALTGATLASNVISSSITKIGTLTSGNPAVDSFVVQNTATGQLYEVSLPQCPISVDSIYRTLGKDSIQFITSDGRYHAILDSAGGGGLSPNFGTQGSILFRGAAGVSQNNSKFFYDSTNNILYVGANANAFSNSIGWFQDSVNNFGQVVAVNKSAGTSASTDFVATENNGGNTYNYVDLGINSSGYTGTTFAGAGVGYLYNQSNSLLIGTDSLVGHLGLVTNNTEYAKLDSLGNFYLEPLTTAGVLHNAVTTGKVTSSLIVNGDITNSTIDTTKWLRGVTALTAGTNITLTPQGLGYQISASGGSSLDSSYLTLNVGKSVNSIGSIWNTSFPGSSAPTMSAGAGLSVTYSNKAIIKGSTYWGRPSQSSAGSAWRAGLQYNNLHMPYDKIDDTIIFVLKTQVTGGLIGVTKSVMTGSSESTVTSTCETVGVDMSGTYTNGRSKVTTDSITSFTQTTADSLATLATNVGDTIAYIIHKDGFSYTTDLRDKNTGKYLQTRFNTVIMGSGGLYNLIVIKDSIHVLYWGVGSQEIKGGVCFIGDSQENGNGLPPTGQNYRWSDLMFFSNSKYFNTIGLPSISAKDWVNNGLDTEIIKYLAPAQVVNCLGYNDETNALGASVYKTSLDSIIAPLQRAGITCSQMGIIPRTTTTADDAYNDTALAVATELGIISYNVKPALEYSGTGLWGGYNSGDNTHINTAGTTVISNLMIADNGSALYQSMAADTTNIFYVKGMRSARTATVNRPLEVEPNGAVVVGINNQLAYIPNVYSSSSNTSTPRTFASPTTAIHTSNEIGTETYFQDWNTNGFWATFADTSTTNTVATNIEITNATGQSTYTTPVQRLAGAGANNVLIGAMQKNSNWSTPTSSMTNNVAIGYNGNELCTSCNNNIFIGNAGWNVATGSYNIIEGAGNVAGNTAMTYADIIGYPGIGQANNHILVLGTGEQGAVPSNGISLSTGTNTNDTLFVGGYNVNAVTNQVISAPRGISSSVTGSSLILQPSGGAAANIGAGSLIFRTPTFASNTTYTNRLTFYDTLVTWNSSYQLLSAGITTNAPVTFTVAGSNLTTSSQLGGLEADSINLYYNNYEGSTIRSKVVTVNNGVTYGTATLSSGTVTVSTAAAKTGSIIILTYNTPSGTLASGLSAPAASIVNKTSFVINSLTTAGIVNTLDNSTVNWEILP